MRSKSKYHYLVCFSSLLLIACSVGMTATVLSVFIPYIRTSLALTNTQASMIITVRSLSAAFFLLFVDKYIDLLGLRRASLGGALML